jgi:anthranilate phosphoribosyltransferase
MAATVTTKSARTAARRVAREAATAAQEAIARRTRENTGDLASFFSAQERNRSVDEWLAERIAAVRVQGEDRRAEHRRAAGAALAAMRARGETVRDIAQMAGIGEKHARELMRFANGCAAAPAGVAADAGAGPEGDGAGETVQPGNGAPVAQDCDAGPAAVAS